MTGEKIDLDSVSSNLLSPTLFSAEAAQGVGAGSDASQWQVQEMDSPPVGPTGNIFAESRPALLQGPSPNPEAEQLEQASSGPSLVELGEHSAPPSATGHEASQQQPSRRERGFDPRRASVAMSSNFALHTAGDGLLGEEEIVVLTGRPPASSASASFRAAMRAANSAYTGRPSGSTLDAHRPPPLSVQTEQDREGGAPLSAAGVPPPIAMESPVAAPGPSRSAAMRGGQAPPTQQSVALRDSMALFLQLEGAVEDRAGYSAEEVIRLASAAKASRALPSIAEGTAPETTTTAALEAQVEEPGPAEGMPSPVAPARPAPCAAAPGSGQQRQAMRGSMALFLQLEGAISGKTPMRPVEVLALDGGNATLHRPAPPPEPSSAEGDQGTTDSRMAVLQEQQQQQPEQQQGHQEQQRQAEACAPAPLRQAALAPAAAAAPTQPLEESVDNLKLAKQATAAALLQAHKGHSPARPVQQQPSAARTLKPSSFLAAAAHPSRLRRPISQVPPPKAATSDARSGNSAAPHHPLLHNATAWHSTRSGIPAPAPPVIAHRAPVSTSGSAPSLGVGQAATSRRVAEPPARAAAAVVRDPARPAAVSRLPLSPKGAGAGNRVLQRRVPSPAKGNIIISQPLGPLAEGRLRAPAPPALASSPMKASRVAAQPSNSVRTSPAPKQTPQIAPRTAHSYHHKTPTPVKKSPHHFERMLEEAMKRGDATAFTGKGAAVKNSPLEGKPQQVNFSRPTAEQRHFQEYTYGD